ncbi:hypothetical protein [Actinokineospora globicatena]|uniref:hypothetical protein n=1 Tax=Actinokineospora globicatena TaxID=103729 RepID=UPI0020A28B9A|nr:hypothetical protein [Actinokineospora globicatena]MCP2303875.1 hypothetical protein [Actinokineospora globicatena]GLW78967.1 hypothetical protein Aglo01_34490 [Actinokineospora globicatena]GLW86622.1 hypothetical protein Aglo02_42610 [Actinokineospora globicatena]
MIPLNLEGIDFHERLVFVWIATGPHGEHEGAFVIDGRDYADNDLARAAIREAVERTDERVPVARVAPAIIRSKEAELSRWRSWAKFKEFLDIYGPIYPWVKNAPPRTQPPVGPESGVVLPPLHDGVHFEAWGQLIKIYPRGEGPMDPVLGVQAEACGLNSYTGEFEANTPKSLKVARYGRDEDDVWPMHDEDDFIQAVEDQREYLLRNSAYHRRDKPKIFAAYEQAARDGTTKQTRRTTYEMWQQHQRRRAFFVIDAEPVRVDLTDGGAPAMAWRLAPTTGGIVSTNQADAEAVFIGASNRVTEDAWVFAVEKIRSTLKVDGEIAKMYAIVAVEPGRSYPRAYLSASFDLWAEKFAKAEVDEETR